MPYLHNSSKCQGKVKWYPPLPLSPKCTECGKTWSRWVLYRYKAPRDMVFILPEYKGPKIKKGSTTYSGWADKVPGAGLIASRLPNWPRKYRIMLVVGIAIIIGLIIWGLTS